MLLVLYWDISGWKLKSSAVKASQINFDWSPTIREYFLMISLSVACKLDYNSLELCYMEFFLYPDIDNFISR